jgi:hypothetical protein
MDPKYTFYLILLRKICKNKTWGLQYKGFNFYEFKSRGLKAVATWEPSQHLLGDGRIQECTCPLLASSMPIAP